MRRKKKMAESEGDEMSMNPGFPFLHIIFPSFISFIHHQKPPPPVENRRKNKGRKRRTINTQTASANLVIHREKTSIWVVSS